MTQTSLTDWATWGEIHAQPEIWRDWGKLLDVAGLRGWVASLDVDEVWFCGAGTSAYIGDIVVSGLMGQGGLRLRAVPSTDLVARPHAYLAQARPLVVSFGRSGNSTESLGTLDVLDALAPNAPRLNITCNPDGALATRKGASDQRVVLLPVACHDAGFAMTSSFTAMLLTALAVFDVTDNPARFASLADVAKGVLPALPDAPAPKRAVYVGSGPLTYVAREAALKVMELSAGEIPALWDSTLGFRHGPKSFVTDNTLISIFVSSDADAARYDHDLADELRAQFPKAQVMTIGPGCDIDISMPHGDTWGAATAIIPAQVAGVRWAQALGYNVDNPFDGMGTLSRVVAGVTLYPVVP